ncbi:MAG TPA: hypothetical protein VJR89_32350 [Polyangiales bacterium]|nr:hypothetical protein [Polyangiales bacterium]
MTTASLQGMRAAFVKAELPNAIQTLTKREASLPAAPADVHVYFYLGLDNLKVGLWMNMLDMPPDASVPYLARAGDHFARFIGVLDRANELETLELLHVWCTILAFAATPAAESLAAAADIVLERVSDPRALRELVRLLRGYLQRGEIASADYAEFQRNVTEADDSDHAGLASLLATGLWCAVRCDAATWNAALQLLSEQHALAAETSLERHPFGWLNLLGMAVLRAGLELGMRPEYTSPYLPEALAWRAIARSPRSWYAR